MIWHFNNKPSSKFMLDILSYKRPHSGKTVDEFVKRFLRPGRDTIADGFGNLYKRVGHSSTLFSCHVDTVHKQDGRQKIRYDKESGFMYLAEWSECLGADNGAGVWLMLNMIDRGVPGLYVFHQGEEKGCLGSKWILENTPELLDGIERAIAFDRRGTTEIVTSMICGKCCSDEFAEALSDGLGMGHYPHRGHSTDVRIYKFLVPECTNLAVGMYCSHRPNESLDFKYLGKLLVALCSMDFEALPVVRSTINENGLSYESSGSKSKNEWAAFTRLFHEGRGDQEKMQHLKIILDRLEASGNPYAIDSADSVRVHLV